MANDGYKVGKYLVGPSGISRGARLGLEARKPKREIRKGGRRARWGSFMSQTLFRKDLYEDRQVSGFMNNGTAAIVFSSPVWGTALIATTIVAPPVGLALIVGAGALVLAHEGEAKHREHAADKAIETGAVLPIYSDQRTDELISNLLLNCEKIQSPNLQKETKQRVSKIRWQLAQLQHELGKLDQSLKNGGGDLAIVGEARQGIQQAIHELQLEAGSIDRAVLRTLREEDSIPSEVRSERTQQTAERAKALTQSIMEQKSEAVTSELVETYAETLAGLPRAGREHKLPLRSAKEVSATPSGEEPQQQGADKAW